MAETMKAWQYTSVAGGMEKNLSINNSVPVPVPGDNEVLIQIHAAGLNPVDHKITESAPLRLLGTVFTPGCDFSGKVVKVGKSVTGLQAGEKVFGAKIGEFAKGSLAQYTVANQNSITKVPENVTLEEAAAVTVTGLTEMQSIKPNVKSGDKVFINGGSGGTGVYGVQIAKALGCHVTTTCSTPNVELCKGLGADEVIDYKTTDVIKALSGVGRVFSLVVDNIGTPANLYKASPAFVASPGNFVQVGASTSLSSMTSIAGNFLRPGFLGGGQAKYQVIMTKENKTDLEQLAAMMKEGKVKSVVDSVFEWKDVPKAYEKLKTGRAKGKIVVRVPQDKE